MIKLLIVEDSEETVDLIRLILSNETDIKVSDANTIKDGMNLVKKDIFDLIYLCLMEMELIYVNKLENFQNFMENHLL